METVYVRAVFDIDCDWEGLPPVYRVFVNDELFTERTWTWTDQHLQEILQIQAIPGRYKVRVESVGPSLSQFRTWNHRIEHGPASWVKKASHIDIYHEST